jgi:hypothetical protein
MFCRNCGTELKTGVRFCSSCGSPTLSEEETASVLDNALVEAQEAFDAELEAIEAEQESDSEESETEETEETEEVEEAVEPDAEEYNETQEETETEPGTEYEVTKKSAAERFAEMRSAIQKGAENTVKFGKKVGDGTSAAIKKTKEISADVSQKVQYGAEKAVEVSKKVSDGTTKAIQKGKEIHADVSQKVGVAVVKTKEISEDVAVTAKKVGVGVRKAAKKTRETMEELGQVGVIITQRSLDVVRASLRAVEIVDDYLHKSNSNYEVGIFHTGVAVPPYLDIEFAKRSDDLTDEELHLIKTIRGAGISVSEMEDVLKSLIKIKLDDTPEAPANPEAY